MIFPVKFKKYIIQGKVQKLKDRQFGRVQLFVPHKNPSAVIGKRFS